MARRSHGLLAATAAVVVAAPPAMSVEDASRCEAAGTTVRANDVARVSRSRTARSYLYDGCVRSTGRVVRLLRTPRFEGEFGPPFDAGGIGLPRLSGTYFAASVGYFDAHEQGVTLWDLATGRSSYWSTGEEDDHVFGDLEVTAEGGVAWVTSWRGVWKSDRGGTREVGRVDPASRRSRFLTLEGTTLSWRQRGRTVSYRLRGHAKDVR
jgi:hypothetical protein